MERFYGKQDDDPLPSRLYEDEPAASPKVDIEKIAERLGGTRKGPVQARAMGLLGEVDRLRGHTYEDATPLWREFVDPILKALVEHGLDKLSKAVLKVREADSKPGVVTSKNCTRLFVYQTFYPTGLGPGFDPLVAGVAFETTEAGLRVTADLVGEGQGTIFFEEAGVAHHPYEAVLLTFTLVHAFRSELLLARLHEPEREAP